MLLGSIDVLVDRAVVILYKANSCHNLMYISNCFCSVLILMSLKL